VPSAKLLDLRIGLGKPTEVEHDGFRSNSVLDMGKFF
jgi:hypothetical protein